MKRKIRVFTLLGLLVLVVPIARGLVRPPSAVAEPRDQTEWEELVARQAEEIGQGDYELVFLGDSITEYWSSEGREVWNAFYGDRNALNLGIGGDRTENLLWRIDNGGLERLSPKVAVLMIGVNNYGVSDGYDISEGTAAAVSRLRKVWPDAQILVVGILPYGWYPNWVRDRMDDANRRTARLEDGRNVHYLNINEGFLNRKGHLLREMMVDHVHLSARGYAYWAEAMEPTLAQLLGDAEQHPREIELTPLASAGTEARPA